MISAQDGTPAFLVGCINEIGLKQKADNVSGLLREESLQSELGLHGEEDMNGFWITRWEPSVERKQLLS